MEISKHNPPHIKVANGEKVNIQIPICCKEGHEDCPHIAKVQRPKKRNIAL